MVVLSFDRKTSQHGVSMIEVLVTIVIMVFGLLGMAGLQARMQVSEMEAYQRAQALVLLNDMANRIAINRNAASSYAMSATDPVTSCTTQYPGSTLVALDKQEWCSALQGAAAKTAGVNQGAVINGRGCVESLGNNEYMVTIAWQGLIPLSAPPTSVACGLDLYDGSAGTNCVSNLCRRVVTTVIRIANLT